jgi:N-acetylglucosamine kinase-like BadF-type ATPase
MCFVIDDTKKIIGRGVAGGSNPNSLGDTVASGNLRASILGALQSMVDGVIVDNEPSIVTLDTSDTILEQRRQSLQSQLRRVRGIAAGLSGISCYVMSTISLANHWMIMVHWLIFYSIE